MGTLNNEVFYMKLNRIANFDVLEYFGYIYELNLIYPTYTKRIQYSNKTIIINVLLLDRNKSRKIIKRNIQFINDLIKENLVEK